MAHLLCHVGEQVSAVELSHFKDNLLIALNSGSFKSHIRTFLDGNVPKPSKTRWYASFEMFAWMLEVTTVNDVTSPRLEKLLASFSTAADADGVTPDSIRVGRLRNFAADPLAIDTVRLQMQVVVSFSLPFVECCYTLEGDGPCAMEVFPCVQRMRAFVALHHSDLTYPDLRQQMQCSAALRGVDISLVELEVNTMLQGSIDYLRRTIDVELQTDVKLYHFCATLNPYEQQSLMPTNFADWTAALSEHFGSWLTPAELISIEREFHDYTVQVEIFKLNHDRAVVLNQRSGSMCSEVRMREIYLFWRRMHQDSHCPMIRKLVQLVLTLTPSSAAAERSFSMLRHLFDLQQLQGGTLSDYVSAAVMSRFRTGNLENEFHK
jgi:hypothetical protein